MANQGVVTPLAACLDIARVHHKVDVIVSIDLVDEPSERRLSDRAVRHVADQGERKWRYAVSSVRRLIGRNAKVKGDKAQQDEARSLFFHGDSLKGFRTAAKVVAGIVVSVN
jgi:hypothetical protein